MKKIILYLFLLTFVYSTKQTIAQCDLPNQYTGNTGSNMTIMLTSGVIDAFPIASSSPYVVALSPNGLIVGSASVAASDLIGGQQSLAVWGDDTATPDIDGALAGQELSFQLVDGTSLYDLDLSFAGLNSFTANGLLPAIAVSAELNCPDYCEEGQWYPPYSGSNTGSNMTVMLLEGFTSSLITQVDSPYIVGVTESNLVVGSASVAANDLVNGQTQLTLWGNDTFTDEIDGASDNGLILLYLIDGNQTFSLNNLIVSENLATPITTSTLNYVTNSAHVISGVDSPVLFCSAQEPLGCMDEAACNYNNSANTDDGSCDYEDLDICKYCIDGIIQLQDSDGDGLCDQEDTLFGCTDETACNYDSTPTLNEDNSTCTYLDGVCETCVEGEIVDNDSDGDGLCDQEDTLFGCTDETACNYDSTPTLNEDNSTCTYLDVFVRHV